MKKSVERKQQGDGIAEYRYMCVDQFELLSEILWCYGHIRAGKYMWS